MHDFFDAEMKEESQDFDRFEWMNAWMRAGLDAVTCAILSALFVHMNKKGQAWPSVETISGMVCRSDRTVRRHLKLAEESGWISTQNRGFNSNLYAASTGHERPDNAASTGHERPADKPLTGHGCPGYPVMGVQSNRSPMTDKQTNEQSIEQKQHAACEREAKKSQDSNSTQTAEMPDPDKDNIWADEFSMTPIREADRMDPMEFSSIWESRTGERIKIFDTRGAGRSARTLLRYFPKPLISDFIQKSGDPGVSNPWRFFVGCLKREASGEGAPSQQPMKRYGRDSIQAHAESCMDKINRLAGLGGDA